MSVVVITGANRGIGLELCRQLNARGDRVIAACRSSNGELAAINGLEIVDGVDVSQESGADALSAAVGDRKVDILINNAGILQGDSLETVNYESMLEQFRVNALGPLRITRALLGNLAAGSKVAIVTSRVGSIADNGSGNNYGYRTSKTAVNMIGANLKHDLAQHDIAVVLLHPGLVATDMTGGNGISPVDSATGLIARIDQLDSNNSGQFLHAEGYELPW